MGAVAYTANVVPIWEGIRDYFRGSAVEMDFVLFSNYEQLVDALMAGWIDIAWNTNLAYARTYGLTDGTCVALAMRDTDATFRSVLVKRTGSELESMADLVGLLNESPWVQGLRAGTHPPGEVPGRRRDHQRELDVRDLRLRCRQARRHRPQRVGRASGRS